MSSKDEKIINDFNILSSKARESERLLKQQEQENKNLKEQLARFNNLDSKTLKNIEREQKLSPLIPYVNYLENTIDDYKMSDIDRNNLITQFRDIVVNPYLNIIDSKNELEAQELKNLKTLLDQKWRIFGLENSINDEDLKEMRNKHEGDVRTLSDAQYINNHFDRSTELYLNWYKQYLLPKKVSVAGENQYPKPQIVVENSSSFDEEITPLDKQVFDIINNYKRNRNFIEGVKIQVPAFAIAMNNNNKREAFLLLKDYFIVNKKK